MKPIKISLAVPGSKSYMNRALVCAGLAKGRSVIKGVVYCDDTIAMLDALQALGVRMRWHPDKVEVFGIGTLTRNQQPVHIGNAGTVMRFLKPYANLVGNARMQQRPITELTEAVMKARKKGKVSITGKVSSQFISSLLMFGATLPKGLVITIRGNLVSAPYVQMTIETMKAFGVKVVKTKSGFKVKHQTYKPANYIVEGDASSATYWWALAAMTGSKIIVTNVPSKTLQPDSQFPQLLKQSTVNMSDCPDAVPAMAMVAACRPGKTTITGIAHLRYKESDRIKVLQLNLRKLGVSVHSTHNSLTITGHDQPFWPAKIKTVDDHRMAMSFAMLQLYGTKLKLDDKNCVKKSYPKFWDDVEKIQQKIAQQTIVLTGMRGVGKTTYGKQLAKQYGMQFVDIDAMIGDTQAIVKKRGWDYFRKLEHKVVKQIANKRNTVIATGGGTLMFDRNVKLLNKHLVVLLTAPLSLIKQRLIKEPRPALTKAKSAVAELGRVWKQRKPKYYALADVVYDRR